MSDGMTSILAVNWEAISAIGQNRRRACSRHFSNLCGERSPKEYSCDATSCDALNVIGSTAPRDDTPKTGGSIKVSAHRAWAAFQHSTAIVIGGKIGTSWCQRKFIYPVTDAVTAAVLIFPPPEPFGTLKIIEPLFRLMLRVPPLKLKIV